MTIDMPEPDWPYVESRILALKARQINSIASAWFNGSIGGASTKRERAQVMASQMRSWWHADDYYGDVPRQRVANVLEMLAEEERRGVHGGVHSSG